ncbi:MAG: hypothetical protein WD357_04920 [Gracilimonas sp.]
MNLFKLLLCVLSCTVILGCGTNSDPKNLAGQWQERGLHDFEIGTLELAEGQIFVGSNVDIYKGDWTSGNIQWETLDFQINSDTSQIRKLLYTNGILYSLLRMQIDYFDLHEEYKVLYKTENLDGTWRPVNIILEGQNKPYVFNNIDGLKDDLVLYGEAGYIFKSDAETENWANLSEDAVVGHSNFLYVSKEHPHQIWTGGSMAITTPYLSKSSDGGETWTNLNQKLSGSNSGMSVYSAILAPENEQVVLAGTGSAIQKSTDGGETWEIVLTGKVIKSFKNSLVNPNRVYATGYSVSESGLFVAISEDYGDTWEVIEYENGPADVETNELKIAQQNGYDVLFFATNNGVYSYTVDL